ncbi:hypothetical protein D3C84_766590 [compost metagenome]
MRIAPPRFRQVAARTVHQHVVARSQPVVDGFRNPVGKAIGVPAHGEVALGLAPGELFPADGLGRLAASLGGAGDDPAGNPAALPLQHRARGIQQAVLAGSGRAYEIDQPAFHLCT